MNSWIAKRVKVLANGCWEWQGAINNKGYGKLYKNGESWLAHRYVYNTFVKIISVGFVVRHKCDYKRCINPEHLVEGTARDNVLDQIERGRLVPPRGQCQEFSNYRRDNE